MIAVPESASSEGAAVASARAQASNVGDASRPGEIGGALEPDLFAGDGTPLPQTEVLPSPESASFRRRIDRLWDAIVNDAPERAEVAFFPMIAYQQVKAIPNPSADWKARLLAAFERDIHAYHRKLGGLPHGLHAATDAAIAGAIGAMDGARFLRIEVPMATAKWMQPGTEGNKLGYFRVLRAKIHFQTGEGAPGVLDVTSMISWRGEWFLVHLGGFK
ncbi:MAG: hypothetical protein NVSMB1_22540 [Polyangiales bacterium]